MNNLRPGAIALLGGGLLLFISTFLDWRTNTSGIDTDFTGLQGLFCLIIGGGIVALVGLTNFGNVNLPDKVVGLTWNQLYLADGVAAFLITFSLQFADFTEFGLVLAWIGAAAIVVGAVLEDRAGPASASSPPTPF